MIVNLGGKASGWPVGARLRFRLDAGLQAATGKGDYDPIQSPMDSNPGLTREKAEEMAAALGF